MAVRGDAEALIQVSRCASEDVSEMQGAGWKMSIAARTRRVLVRLEWTLGLDRAVSELGLERCA